MARQKRLKPKAKQDKASWKKRHDARSVLQSQHAARVLARSQAD